MAPAELEEIRRRLADCGPMDAGAGHDAVALLAHVDALQAQLDKAKEEFSSLAASREEIRMRAHEYRKEVLASRHRAENERLTSERDAAQAEVERLREALGRIEGLCCHLRSGGCDVSDLPGLEDGLSEAVSIAFDALSELEVAS